MPRALSFLRIEQERSSQLNLVSAERRWLILIISLIFTVPLVFFGALLLGDAEAGPYGAAIIFFCLFILILVLMFVPFKSQLMIDASLREVTLTLYHWLGFGPLERNREIAWSFDDFTDARLASQGWKNLVELKSGEKKVLLLDFGRKAVDAQRSCTLFQCWLKGIVPDSSATTVVLQELASEKQNQTVKNAEKLLYYFGIFSLIDGALSLYTDSTLHASISTLTILKVFVGIVYLVCRQGVKRKSEMALWIAILVVLAERLYWFLQSMSLGNVSWTSWLTWVFAILVVSSLWQAIQSIRAMEKEPVYEPLL